jgi:hypothetical protein
MWFYGSVGTCVSEEPAASFFRVLQGDTKNGNFDDIQTYKTYLWRQHAVDRSTDPWLLNGEVVCSSRYLFHSAANCTWLPRRISKVTIFCESPCTTFFRINCSQLPKHICFIQVQVDALYSLFLSSPR